MSKAATGNFAGQGSVDLYGNIPEPSPYDLLEANEDVVFACVNLISQGCASFRPRLCMKQNAGDNLNKPLQKRYLPKSFKEYIKRDFASYGTRKAIEVHEVVDHPLLDLVDNPNPKFNFGEMVGHTITYLDTIGSAFWYKAGPEYIDEDGFRRLEETPDGQQIIKELWLLPAQTIEIVADDEGYLDYYEQRIAHETIKIHRDRIIHFKHFNGLDPYTGFGISPLRSVWQRVMLLRQEQSAWNAILANAAIPSAVISPTDPNVHFTDTQVKRLEAQYLSRFRLGRLGLPWIVDDAIDYKPISTPPKDITALTMYEQIKECIANSFAIPLPLLRMDESNFPGAQTAERFFQKHCLKPRARLIFETLTREMCGNSNVFFCCDEVVEPDRTFELQRTSALWQANLITQNEGRIEQGIDPVSGGDKFLFQLIGTERGTSGTMGTLPSFQEGKQVKKKSINPPNPQPLVEALTFLFAALEEHYLPNSKAINPEDWQESMRELLSPILRAYYEEGSREIKADLGLMKPLPVNALNDAVESAILHLAQSTLETTELEVEAAKQATREAIRQGLAENEANRDLAKRIQAIFTDLKESRVYLIADTESTRAKAAGEVMTLQNEGVEAKKVWLPDSLACDICRGLEGSTKELNEPFAVIGTGPYSVINHPPAHPSCRCVLTYEVHEAGISNG